MMSLRQQCYDESEAALKRALEIGPDYAHARHNLNILPLIRETGGASNSSSPTHGIDIFFEED